MRKITILTTFIMVMFLAVASVNAQVSTDTPFSDLPPTSEYGKCYAKCKVPDVYETITLQKLKKEASTKLVKIPAKFETQTEQTLKQEAYTKYKIHPATFKTVSEQVLVKPESRKLRTISAKYTTESKQILVEPARGKWVKKRSPNCFSQNPKDCYVACYEEVPAKYRTEKYQVLASPATTTEEVIPAVYKTITHKVIDRPARVEEIVVPATYKTITKKVLVSPASVQEETIPAVYGSVTEKRLVSKGGFTVWTEILCAAKTTSSKIYSVQRALKAAGYNPGAIDGIMGLQTTNALKKFQQDKGLPIGNLNIETLNTLGVQ